MATPIAKFYEATHDKPLYTRTNLKHIQAQLERIENGAHTFVVFDYADHPVIKQSSEVIVPPSSDASHTDDSSRSSYSGTEEIRPTPAYSNYQRMSEALAKGFSMIPIDIVTKDMLYHKYQTKRPDLGVWREKWEKSKVRKDVLEVVSRAKDKSNLRISKIVCFGKGSMGYADDDDDKFGSLVEASTACMQHLLVCDVAKKLDEIYAAKDAGVGAGGTLHEPIKITAQDPAYTPDDKVTLSKLNPPISVVEDPQGLLEIDKSTFIIAIGVTMPLRQIIADLFFASDRADLPAGMLWTSQEEDDGHATKDSNLSSLRVKEMMGNYEAMGDFGAGGEVEEIIGGSRFWFRRT